MTTTTTRNAGGTLLREVGEGPPPRPDVRASVAAVVAVVAFVLALVVLPLAQVVSPGVVVTGVALWIVLRIGVPVRSIEP